MWHAKRHHTHTLTHTPSQAYRVASDGKCKGASSSALFVSFMYFKVSFHTSWYSTSMVAIIELFFYSQGLVSRSSSLIVCSNHQYHCFHHRCAHNPIAVKVLVSFSPLTGVDIACIKTYAELGRSENTFLGDVLTEVPKGQLWRKFFVRSSVWFELSLTQKRIAVLDDTAVPAS